LAKRQVELRLDVVLHGKLIELFIGLGSRRVHCWAFGTVQHSKLNAARVNHPAHLAAKGINLADNLTFRNTTDGWVAAHLRDCIGAHG
jgi:hypothetical protein